MLAFPVLRVAIVAAVLGLSPALAQTTWTLPTEYPATAIPGEGVTAFAEAVNRRTGGPAGH